MDPINPMENFPINAVGTMECDLPNSNASQILTSIINGTLIPDEEKLYELDYFQKQELQDLSTESRV